MLLSVPCSLEYQERFLYDSPDSRGIILRERQTETSSVKPYMLRSAFLCDIVEVFTDWDKLFKTSSGLARARAMGIRASSHGTASVVDFHLAL